ncbi:MAG: hypothetical protein ACRDI2_26085, partial [Chloroflexota bacterium]
MAYRAVWRPERGKWTKVPYDPHTDPKRPRPAASNDPTTWETLALAAAFARASEATGVGYVFRAPPPIADEDDLAGVDLDACRDPETDQIAPWAWAIIRRLDSYTEVSPSGTGVHVLVEGTLPPGWRKRSAPAAVDVPEARGGPGVPPVPSGANAAIEVYDSGRFFTVTGCHVAGTPTTIEPRGEALARLHAELAAPDAPLPAGPPPEPTRNAADEALLA